MANTANFSATTSRVGTLPLEVTFQDSTTGDSIVYRRWTLGDGNVVENQTNFTHTYIKEGIYNVSLYARDMSSGESTEIKKQYIIVNGSYPTAENTIIQSEEAGGDYWRFYIDSDLKIAFRRNGTLYRTNAPEAVEGEWMLIEYHSANNFIYVGTADNPRKITSSTKIDLGSTPTVANDRLFVAQNGSMQIDEVKVWSREEDLLEYYRSLKARASTLN